MLAALSPGTAWGADLLAMRKKSQQCRPGSLFRRAALDLL
jgi:hypothetical protein